MKTIIIVQCRLSSTRLPEKALYDLGGNVLLELALKSMKCVKVDDYFVACDYESKDKLLPIVFKNGFKIFTGSCNDVLDRFCKLIEQENPDIVVRATADNPFLFFDAAEELLELYKTKYFNEYDYITFCGLPHGSGIEIFKANSLLKARTNTNSNYDHEHVGPSIYNHKEIFNSLFLPAPKKYNFPEYRTTIDTYADYLRALEIVNALKEKNKKAPFKSFDVLNVLENSTIQKKILYIPCIKKGQGTGHLRRCLELAKKTNGCIYLDLETEELNLQNGKKIEQTIDYKVFFQNVDEQNKNENFNLKYLITKLPLKNEYDLIVLDQFCLTKQNAKKYLNLGKTVLLDEGSKFTENADYVLDIIPSNLKRKSNFFNPQFIEVPKNKKNEFSENQIIKNVLICFGGEDPSNLTEKFLPIFLETKCFITVVSSNKKNQESILQFKNSRVNIQNQIPNLKEKIYEYDLVITHYGFTAFECVYANTPVLLAATTSLHKKLSDHYGFFCLNKNQITKKNVFKILQNVNLLKPNFKFHNSEKADLSSFIINLAKANVYACPICQSNKKGKILERTVHHTFRKCPNCNIIYISFSDDSETVKYEKTYFSQEYKKQYGKTYLEDFAEIKKKCIPRIRNIDCILKISNGKNKKILDLGCAYGPFLSAAFDDNWQPYGSDIAQDAIDYVKTKLGFNAVVASFTEYDFWHEFGIKEFDAITMWYVIEHIQNLKKVLSKINQMLKPGGVFAFSTPNGNGISRKINQTAFFISSPKDHYSIWELSNTQKYLSRFGFKVYKIVPTGIHPERHPFIKKHHISKNKLLFKFIKIIMKVLKIGDTYEVYCKKNNEIEYVD